MKTLTHTLVVTPEKEWIYSEMATFVGLEDEGGGLYVTVTQYGRGDKQKIGIDIEDWPAIRRAINKMVKICKAHNVNTERQTVTPVAEMSDDDGMHL